MKCRATGEGHTHSRMPHTLILTISSAFHSSEIDSKVYMNQPEGFLQGDLEFVLHLKKSIYGLCQSPCLGHKKLNSVLGSLGFKKIKCDASVWVCDRESVRVIVDDMTLVSKSKGKIRELKEELKAKGLETSGTKPILLARLKQAPSNQGFSPLPSLPSFLSFYILK